MSSRQLIKALYTQWVDEGVDATFTALWPSDRTDTDFNVFNDGEAPPEQPWPYVVMEQTPLGDVEHRMTGSSPNENSRIQRDLVVFNVWANKVESDSRTAKEIAADMADVVMGVYGDMVSSAQKMLTFDVGAHILTQYIRDYGVRPPEGDDEYQWIVVYEFLYDIPVIV